MPFYFRTGVGPLRYYHRIGGSRPKAMYRPPVHEPGVRPRIPRKVVIRVLIAVALVAAFLILSLATPL